PSFETRPFLKSSAVNNSYRAPWVPTVNRHVPPVNIKFSTDRRNFPTANRKFPTASRKFTTGSTKNHTADMGRKGKAVKPSACWTWNPSQELSNKGNISYLSDFEPFDGGYVFFGQEGCKITGKGTIKTDSECIVLRRNFKLLDDTNILLRTPMQRNMYSINLNNIVPHKDLTCLVAKASADECILWHRRLECIVLGRNFKQIDDTNILLRTPKQHNMYSIDLNNIVPHKDLTCLVAKASADECILWHRRLGHLNVKTMNKLVRHNLVRGLPTKSFDNDHTCTARRKGKQHKASFVTDDFSRFTWTFFLRSKDETSDILKKFITEIENLKDYKVKIIRCDNGGEFKNKEMNDFCSQKGIKREFSNARTPRQTGVAER
nr:hypothetical protein [Tanacetum cinerariifolium]